MNESKQTTLHELHTRMGAKFVEFAGYSMPVQYTDGVLKEHLHTRKYAGFFDVSHMGQMTVRPKSGLVQDLIESLEFLIPSDLTSMPINRQCYSMLTNKEGGILDDIIITNRGTHFHIVVNASQKYSDFDHLQKYASDKCNIDLDEEKSLVAIQGPYAQDVLSNIFPETSKLNFLDSFEISNENFSCLISRSGYTGEDGFEISIRNDDVVNFANELFKHKHLKPIGLGARDSLRLEAGLCLYGNDLTKEITPPEAALTWTIHKSRQNNTPSNKGFLGSDIILNQIKNGVKYIRVGLFPIGKAPMRQGSEIYQSKSGVKIGTVTSGGFSPTLNRPISMGRIDKAYSDLNSEILVKVRDKFLPAKITKLPFISHKYKKI